MRHLTIAVLSADEQLKSLFSRSWGKKGTASDIALFTLAKPDVITTVIPSRYPEKPISLVIAAHMSDFAVLPIPTSGITPSVAEAAILADTLSMKGIRVVVGDSAPAFDSLHTTLEGYFKERSIVSWPKLTLDTSELNQIRDELLKLTSSEPPADQDPIIEVDHAFSVQGVGSVVLGTVIQGIINKGDKIYTFPDRNQGNIRSIQVNDEDVKSATPRTHVGLAIRGILPKDLFRGTILTTNPDLVTETTLLDAINLKVAPFIRNLEKGKRVHAVVGLYDTPAEITELSMDGNEAKVSIRLDKAVPIYKGIRLTLLNLNEKQRIIGSFIL